MTAIFSSKPMRAAIAATLFAVFSTAAHAQVSVVNAASFRVGNPVAPGGLASAFLGSPLAVETTVAADLPLPTTLASVRLLANDVPASLIFVSAGQINFQIPSGVPIGEEVAVQVVVDGGAPQTGAFMTAAADPGIIFNTGTNEAVALHGADNSLVSSTSPAARGEVIVLYAVGPGATDPPVPDGTAAGGNPFSRIIGETKVFVGGIEVEAGDVLFSGLAPGSVGLWQINFRTPQDAALAGEVPLRITLDGIASNTPVLPMTPAAPSVGEEDCSGLLSMAPTESPLRLGCFVSIPPGEFTMGSESAEAQANEKPLTRVRISRGFQMGKYEVTKEEWLLIAGPSPYADPDCNVGCPADNMTWDELQSDFLMRLNERDPAFTYRLPTEAEWEYAARAGASGDRYGDADSVAWHRGNSSGELKPVGQKQPNAWGLYDMLGNVFEWVQDIYDPRAPYPGGEVTDPTGPESGSLRVRRGGSFTQDAGESRAPARAGSSQGLRRSDLGFRLVRTPK